MQIIRECSSWEEPAKKLLPIAQAKRVPEVIGRPGVFRDRKLGRSRVCCDVWVTNSNRKFQWPQVVHQCTGVGRVNFSKCTPNGPSILASASLVVRNVHQWKAGNSGKEHVMSLVRQRYWITKAHPLVRDCVICKNRTTTGNHHSQM